MLHGGHRHTGTRALVAALVALAIAATAPATAGAGVRVGASGWTWGDPSPTGADITAIAFAGQHGYAVGAFGTLMRSSDRGATWRGLPTGVRTPLTELDVLSGRAFVVGGGCLLRRSDDGGKTFTRMEPDGRDCDEPLEGVSFTGPAGYVVLRDGRVVGTTDTGRTWSPRTPLPGTRSAGGDGTPTDLEFLTPTAGFAATTQGRILGTADGGGSWVQLADAGRAIHDLTFVSPLLGFAVGADGLFLATADGGATWAPRFTGTTDALMTVAATPLAPQSAIATTETGDAVLRTTDGGATFSRLPAAGPVHAAAFVSPRRVVVAGAPGAMATSRDGGATFTPIGSPPLAGQYFVVRAAPGGAAFAAGERGALARTTDRGRSWGRARVPTSKDVLDVSFPARSVGYALDTGGRLFRSADTGSSWTRVRTGTSAHPQTVFAPSTRTVLLVGPKGVRRSTDRARTFTRVDGAVRNARLDDYDEAGDAIFVSGRKALLRSRDKGRTWRELDLPTPETTVSRVDFVSARTGFLCDTGGRLWKTTDGGEDWDELPGVGTRDFYGMAFSSAKRGYLVMSEFGRADELGWLLRTSDGGRTWAPQLVADTEIKGYGIAAGSTSYVLAGTRSLFSTRGSGQAGRPSSVALRTAKRRLTKKGRIDVKVAVEGAREGDVAVVSRRRGGGDWVQREVELDADGEATTEWSVGEGTTTFVGQWAGNEASAGDGSGALTVEVGD